VGFLLVRTVLDWRQPFEDVVAHYVFPSHHKACVPGVLIRFGLHHDISAFRATLYRGQYWPVIMSLRLVLSRWCRGQARSFRAVGDQEGNVMDTAPLDALDGGVVDA